MNYYRLISTFEPGVPTLYTEAESPHNLYKPEPIIEPGPVKMGIGDPVPPKMVFKDYLMGDRTVISEKVYQILKPIDFEKVQFLPTVIYGPDGEVFENYQTIHSYNQISCLDKVNSICEVDDGMLFDEEKIILDKNILREVPLPERLIFRMGEAFSYELFHENIVEMISDAGLTGFKFIHIESWHAGSIFD